MRRSSRRHLTFLAVLFLLGIGVLEAIHAQTPSNFSILEENINPVPEGEALIALTINRIRYGDVEARIELEDPFIQVELLREALAPFFSDAQNNRIFSGILSKLEWAGMADLEAAGILGLWDMETLTYYLTTPGEYTALRELDFSPRPAFNDKNWLKPAPIAGIINFSATGTSNFTQTGVTIPVAVSANGLLNVFSIAIESNASMTYAASALNWYFSSARAIYDLPFIEGRMYAGMVGGQGIGYQSRPEIYGISVHNIENFSRYDRNYSPSTTFTLQKPSTVRIKINGNVVRSMSLDMGNYRVYDLPFAYGLNDFELEVQESGSKEGIIIYKPATKYVSVETGLLVGGKTDFGFSAGVGRSDPTQPFISAYVRHGLQSYLTIVGNAQADARSALWGIGFVSGTDIGGFLFNAAALTAWDGRADSFAYSADLDYRFALPANTRAPGLGFSVGYASKGFTSPQPVTSVSIPNASLNVSGHIGGSISRTVNYGFSSQWKRNFTSTISDTINVALNMGFAISKNSSISLSTGVSLATAATPDYSLSFALSASDPVKPGRQLSYTQSDDGTSAISFNDQIRDLDDLGYGLRITNPIGGVSEYSSFAISSGFDTPFFTLSGTGGLNWGGALNIPNGAITANLGTAISFAGTSFAVSKPLYDSFVIFDPDKTTGNMPVAFAVDAGTRIISHGLPVAAPMGSYRQQRVTMDFPEADADVSATVPQIALSSGYRSGFLFKAGLEKRLYLIGYLVDVSGAPITYVAGDVIADGGQMLDQTFTDDTGMFQIFGVTQGRYTIHWPEDVGESVITVIEDDDGLVEVGQISATSKVNP